MLSTTMKSEGRQYRKDMVSLILCLLFIASSCNLKGVIASTSTGNNNNMILRVRKSDGSMDRLQIPKDKEGTMSLKEVLSTVLTDGEDESKIKLKIGSSDIKDTSQTLSSLGLKHGSLITIIPPESSNKSKSSSSSTKSKRNSSSSNRFDPYPDLAKDYVKELHKTKSRRGSRGSLSYGDIANLQSALHVVEAQPSGNVKRCYMCKYSAERFQTNGFVKNKAKKQMEIQCRVALLLGNVNRERTDMNKPKKTRTSLSSTPSDRDYCDVIKVHTLWEPPQKPKSLSNKSKLYDPSGLLQWDNRSNSQQIHRVIKVASFLGLKPVGWIFSYVDKRQDDNTGSGSSNDSSSISSRRKSNSSSKKKASSDGSSSSSDTDEGSLPVWGYDVRTGALLQICNMKDQPDDTGRIEGSKFITLAMDGNTGATEAFQLSDTTVQMVSESNLLIGDDTNDKKSGSNNSRFVKTKHSILVDGKETNTLDSVLCLINTAMLSHEGLYAGGSSTNPIKKNGLLTNKMKKQILTALSSCSSSDSSTKKNNSDSKLIELLSDFNIILSLDTLLNNDDEIIKELCTTIRKYARGQKRGTVLGNKIKLLLQSVLEM